MITIMALCGAAKKTKKPVFGQMTLTGEKALDWVKDGVKVAVSKIQMGSPSAFADWNIPEWGLTKDCVAILFPIDKYANPFLVTQKSILRVLEAHCAEWEEAGAPCDTVRSGGSLISEITFAENQPSLEFVRPENAKTYDPYKVIIE